MPGKIIAACASRNPPRMPRLPRRPSMTTASPMKTNITRRKRRSTSTKTRSDLFGAARFLFLTRFLHANRCPPTDQVRGHASLENALALIRLVRAAVHPPAHREEPQRSGDGAADRGHRDIGRVIHAA